MEDGEAYNADLRLAAARQFARRGWNVDQTINWIAFRDPVICERRYRAGLLYPETIGPREALLRALKNGSMKSMRHSGRWKVRPRSTRTWCKISEGARVADWPEDFFLREDVLRLWPDLWRPSPSVRILRREAPRWFKVSSEADAKAWDQEVKARLISTDESEAGIAFGEPHGQNLISCNALPEGSERERK